MAVRETKLYGNERMELSFHFQLFSRSSQEQLLRSFENLTRNWLLSTTLIVIKGTQGQKNEFVWFYWSNTTVQRNFLRLLSFIWWKQKVSLWQARRSWIEGLKLCHRLTTKEGGGGGSHDFRSEDIYDMLFKHFRMDNEKRTKNIVQNINVCCYVSLKTHRSRSLWRRFLWELLKRKNISELLFVELVKAEGDGMWLVSNVAGEDLKYDFRLSLISDSSPNGWASNFDWVQ